MAGSNRSPSPPRGPGHSGWPPSDAEPTQQAPSALGAAHEDPLLRWAQQRGAVPGYSTSPSPAGQGSLDPYSGHARADGYGRQPASPYPRVDYPSDAGRGLPQGGHIPNGQMPGPTGFAQGRDPIGHPPAVQHPVGHGPLGSPDDVQHWNLSTYSAHPAVQHPSGSGRHDPRAATQPAGYDSPALGHGSTNHPAQHAYSPPHSGAYSGQNWGQETQPHSGYGPLPGGGYSAENYETQGAYATGSFPAGNQTEDQHYAHDGAYEAESEMDEPDRRGPRPFLVIVALIGAIGVGGGLAYGYRMLNGAVPSGKPPVVKADAGPAKARPADPGGREEAHKDKKFVNRLSDSGGQQTAAPSGGAGAPAVTPPVEPEAPRKVTTLVVNKDGTITPQAQLNVGSPPPAVPPPAVAHQSIGPLPGMVVEGLPPRQPPRAAAAEPQPPVSTVAKAPPVADLPLPKAKASSAVIEAKPETASPRKKPAPRDDWVARSTPNAPAVAPSAGGTVIGFVPVLASKKTREEALKSFADLAARYPEVLSSKAPDVVEANLQEKGLWYRTVVGPPGSREAAREVCAKLEAAGFKGCWVTSYRQ